MRPLPISTSQEAFMKLRDIVGTDQAKEMYDLFMEYEAGTTKEAKLVKQLDKLDMILQANESDPFTPAPI